MSSSIKPLADRVLIKRLENEDMSPGGIVIPDSAKEKPAEGEVVAVGPGKKDHEMTVKAGDHVLFGKFSGTEVKLNGETFMIMREDDILGVIA